jgi:ribulose-phosphate 3-epimerase
MALEISAALLGADPLRLGRAVDDAAAAGADLVHVDVMDGHFTDEFGFAHRTVAAVVAAAPLPVEVHLQVTNPERHAVRLAASGAESVTVHVESTPHVHRLLREIRSAGARAGVAVNPATPVSVVAEVAHLVDLVLLMTSDPGTSDYATRSVVRAQALREVLAKEGAAHVAVAADGGVNRDVARAMAPHVDRLIAASAVFRGGDVAANITALRTATAR